FGYFGHDQSNPPEGRKGDYAPPSRMNTYLMWMLTSKKQEARSKKQEARSKKQEARSELVCFDSANRPFAMATLTHLFAGMAHPHGLQISSRT
ncbi:hypothetical protein, partial [Pseudomonas putida]|uniref:hypothetical protein n=1 Tax=Pseudomonas putida TaxID=303 RepID=UPI0023639C49